MTRVLKTRKKQLELEEFFRNVLFALDEEVPRREEMLLSYLIHLTSPERTSTHVTSLSNIILTPTLEMFCLC